MIHYIKIALLFGALSTVYSFATPHLFEVEKGMIMYAISGGGQLTAETNLSIKGVGKLRFRAWGNVKIEEDQGFILTSGAIKHKQNIKRFEKQTEDKIITADYVNKQLLVHPRHKEKYIKIDKTEGLSKTSKEEILGVICDVWEGMGIKKCIYKGLVLKVESDIWGITYHKVATSIRFDINTSKKACIEPNYPVQEFGLFNDSLKTKNKYKIENFCKILKEATYTMKEFSSSKKVKEITNAKRKKFINTLAREIYVKQRELLPALLHSMKQTRECLQIGEHPFETNECLEKFSRMKLELGNDKSDFIILWDTQQKDTLLDRMEDEITYLQSRMPCIKRTKNITDLSTCMK